MCCCDSLAVGSSHTQNDLTLVAGVPVLVDKNIPFCDFLADGVDNTGRCFVVMTVQRSVQRSVQYLLQTFVR